MPLDDEELPESGEDIEEWDERASFVGTCTCRIVCLNYDSPETHDWGECGEPNCECEAGWEE